jgi:uncharacterized protein YdaU (DUF1376 family)
MSLPYYPMYPADFEADTSHLTLAEDGAYNRLLRLCWRTPGCSLPNDRPWIHRRMRCVTDDDRAVVDTVLDEFFVLRAGRLSNTRLSREWASANASHERRKLSGSRGGLAKSRKNNESEPTNTLAKPKQPEPEPYIKKERPIGLSKESTPEPPHDPASGAAPQSAARPAETTGPPKSPRGTRICVETLPDDWRLFALDAKHPSPDREFQVFRDYWIAQPGQRGVKADWLATWRNWIRKAVSELGTGPPGGRRPMIDHGRINDELMSEARMLDAQDFAAAARTATRGGGFGR